MAWITPVTNREANSRTSYLDMNRIVGNVAHLGGNPEKLSYTKTDIVMKAEWDYVVQFAQIIDATVTDSTRFDNLNKIEAALIRAHELYPANTLYPSDSLIIHGDPEE